MKKTRFIFVSVILLLSVLTSCGATSSSSSLTSNTPKETTEETLAPPESTETLTDSLEESTTTPSPPETTPPIDLSKYEFHLLSGGSGIGGVDFSTKFDPKEQHGSHTIPTDSYSLTFGEITCQFNYSCTRKIAFFDQYWHRYALKTDQAELSGYIDIDPKTNKIVRYGSIPCGINFTDLTEEEYLNAIMERLGDRYDFSRYQYEPCTLVRDAANKRKTLDGFLTSYEDGEIIGYQFFFSRYIEGIDTLYYLHIKIQEYPFSDESYFSTEFYDDNEYTESDFSEITTNIRDYDSAVLQFVYEKAAQTPETLSLEIKSCFMFLYEGVPYICYNIESIYSPDGVSGTPKTLKIVVGKA